MRLLISLCRHCSRERKDCFHHKMIRSRISPMGKATLTYHCQEYYKIIPLNTDVEVELHELETWDNGSDDWGGKWVSAGWAKGVVIGAGRKGFMQVKLNEPVELVLPKDGESWHLAEAHEITHWSKRVKDIKVIGVGDDQITEVGEGEEGIAGEVATAY